MTDQQIYERALAELRRCEERVEQLRAFIQVYEEIAGPATPTQAVSARSSKPRETAGVVTHDWEQMVAEAIRRAGRPLRVAEIYEAIIPMGFSVDSENPKGVLGTRIMRSSRFHKPARGVYALSETPNAAPVVARQETSQDDDADEESVAQSVTDDAGASSSLLGWEQAARGV